MLRYWFGDSKRESEGLLDPCFVQMDRFCERLRERSRAEGFSARLYSLDLFAQGLKRSLDELEQSVFCSFQFSRGFKEDDRKQLRDEHADDYHRYLYFYKNGMIRVFANLDKLGYFMNDWFHLHTEKVKPKFSYFTVLRQLRHMRKHHRLESRLYRIKVTYQPPLQRLRLKRNLEIHLVNVEMIDDLYLMESRYLERQHLESVSANLADLRAGYEMVCKTMYEVFHYVNKTN